MDQNNTAVSIDKTVAVSVLFPKSLRTNIELEAEHNKNNQLGNDNFSAVLTNRLFQHKELPASERKMQYSNSDKERLVKRNITIPQSLQEEIDNEARDNGVNHRPFKSFSSVIVKRLQEVKQFIKPE